jgi:ferric-dicitrate binding protein FerR (iron transport regulator)
MERILTKKTIMMRPSASCVGLLLAAMCLGNLYCKGRGGAGGEGGQAVAGENRPAAGEGLSAGGAVDTGRLETVGLPDGSRVMKKNRTVIRLSKTFNQKERVLDLDGEAIFEIVADAHRPFIIHTRNLEIAVIGTETRMRVDAYRSNAGEQVDLLEGRLRVKKSYHSDTDNEAEFLEGGEMIMINRDIDLMEKEKLDSAELSKLRKSVFP